MPKKYLIKIDFNMKDKIFLNIRPFVFLITFFIVVFLGCSQKEPESGNNDANAELNEPAPPGRNEKAVEIAVESPPFTEGIFPCSECHADLPPNPVRRELVDFHDDISQLFNHDSENRWCLDCHDLIHRDSLKLASGKLLDFKESYKLCGQCHGDKYRDWKVGVHGKRKGEWNGKKEYLLCVNCHNPHSPKFEELVPELPPVRQEDIK